MGNFEVFPAIDLRLGKVVRLQQGKLDRVTIYSDDAAGMAETWIAQGAQWLHVVNLDGAFGERTQANEKALGEILSESRGKVKVQVGGGFRQVSQIEAALNLGVARVILGTRVIQEPAFGVAALERFGGDRLAFAFDAADGRLMVSGWQSQGEIEAHRLAQQLVDSGARTLIYTNIHRDGMQSGVDWESARAITDQTAMDVIASGGVATLDDILMVRSAGLSGVVVGRALYEGNFSLREALDVR